MQHQRQRILRQVRQGGVGVGHGQVQQRLAGAQVAEQLAGHLVVKGVAKTEQNVSPAFQLCRLCFQRRFSARKFRLFVFQRCLAGCQFLLFIGDGCFRTEKFLLFVCNGLFSVKEFLFFLSNRLLSVKKLLLFVL